MNDRELRRKYKQETFLLIVTSGRVARVMFDPRHPDVVVPSKWHKDAFMAVDIGLMMPQPIDDLYTADGGFTGTLAFDFRPFKVTVMWDAVFSIVSRDGIVAHVWPEEIPADIHKLGENQPSSRQQPAPSRSQTMRKLPPGWGVIQGGRTRAVGAMLPVEPNDPNKPRSA